MAIRDLLPRTRQPFLLAAILFLVAGLVLEALLGMWNYLVGGSWGSLALAVFGIALATGLWRLHPAARWSAVFLLWLAVILDVVMLLGIFNPFFAMELHSRQGRAPGVLELAAQVWPAIAVLPIALAILHVLGKHKAEFRR